MADLTTTPVLSVCTTVGSKLADVTITDGQLIYVRDKHKIAFDFDGKRTIYNQIEELATDAARSSLLAPVSGLYYFVVETATLWTYRDVWVQLTTKGADGYTPVRGTDYWTADDIATIKSYVDDAILGGAW